MIYYRVYIDGTLMPKAIDLTKFSNQIERGLQTKTMMRKFSGDVDFVDEGYAYLKSLLDVSPCGEVEVLITGNCEGTTAWLTVSEGVVVLSECEIYLEECRISASIKPTSLSALFTKYKGLKINMDATASINGVFSLPVVRRPLRNFVDENGTLLLNTNGVNYAYGYEIGAAFGHIVDYITDGELEFVSDFFSTEETRKQYQVIFDTTPVSGEVITFVYTDDLNYTRTVNITSNGNATDFIARVQAAFFTAGSSYGFNLIDGSVTLGEIDFDFYAYSSNPTFTGITSTGATVISYTLATAYVPGGKYYYLTDGNHLSNRIDEILYMTFDRLFTIADTWFDLGISIEKSGTQWQLRIEPKEYFFNNSVTLDLGAISGATIKYDDDRLAKSVTLEDQSYLFKNLTGCKGSLVRQQDDVHIDIEQIVDQINGTRDYDDDIFFVKGQGLPGAYDEPEIYQFTTVSAFTPAIIFSDQYYYNWALINPDNLLQYHLFFLPDAVFVNSRSTVFNINLAGSESSSGTAKSNQYLGNELQFYKIMDFERDISLTNFLAFNEYTMMEFTFKGETYNGYVLNLDRDLETGGTEINLLIK